MRRVVRWACCGAIAGCAEGAVCLALRQFWGMPMPFEIIQDRLLALVPGALMARLIETLRFGAKPLALLGWGVTQVLVGAALAGVAGPALDARGHPPRWLRGAPRLLLSAVLCGLLAWLAVEALWLAALGIRPLALGTPHGLESARGMLLPVLAYGLVVALLSRLLAGAGAPAGRQPLAPSRMAQDRRRAIALAFSAAIVGSSAAEWRRVLDQLDERGTRAGSAARDDAHDEGQGVVAALTTNTAFYVVSKNAIDPELEADGWALVIDGLVERPRRLDYQALRAVETVEQYTTLECISNRVGGDLMSTALWRGAPLAVLLDTAGVQEAARWAVFTSADGYEQSLPLAVARRSTTIVAHMMNGAPLPTKHGFPARLLVAGRYGMKNPKWLTRIELRADRFESYWERTGWDGDKGVETMARFDTRPARAVAYTTVRLGGVAFAGDRGVDRVEISADGGHSWFAATLEPALSAETWMRWTARWQAGPPGRYHLRVRAADGAGTLQTAAQQYTYPSGATGYDALALTVT